MASSKLPRLALLCLCLLGADTGPSARVVRASRAIVPRFSAGVSANLGIPSDVIDGECAVVQVSEALAARLSVRPDRDEVKIVFVSATTPADFESVVRVPWLKRLRIESPLVTELRPIAELPALEELVVDGPELRNLAALAPLRNLKQLAVEGAQSISDVGPLAQSTGLRGLRLVGSGLRSLDALRAHRELRELVLPASKISDLSPLAGLPELRRLDVRESAVAQVASLSHLGNLEVLDLSRTRVEDLSPLAHLDSLQVLDISGTRVSSLPDFAPGSHLRVLRAARNPRLEKIQSLASVASLVHVDVSDTGVKDVSMLRVNGGVRQVFASYTDSNSPAGGVDRLPTLRDPSFARATAVATSPERPPQIPGARPLFHPSPVRVNRR